MCFEIKVTVRPEFFGTVPNFEGLSRKNTRSFGTLNCPEFRTLSRICPDLMSRCVAIQAVDKNAVDYFDVFACQRCVLFSSVRTKSPLYAHYTLATFHHWCWLDAKRVQYPKSCLTEVLCSICCCITTSIVARYIQDLYRSACCVWLCLAGLDPLW